MGMEDDIFDRIASEYEADLAGDNGARVQLATVLELIRGEISQAINGITFSGTGPVKIFGSDGYFVVESPPVPAPVIPEKPRHMAWVPKPWDLLAGSVAGGVKVNVGTILKTSDQITEGLTCSNPTDEFTPTEGGFLAIKITDVEPTDYEIVLLTSWPESDGYTATYTGTVATNTFAMTARHYPLWYFRGEASSGTSVVVSSGVHGEKLVPDANLGIVNSLYRTPDGEYITLPDFEVAHKVFVPFV